MSWKLLNSYCRKKIKSTLLSTIITQKLSGVYSSSVLLTFDDGPDPQITPKVLELLKSYGVRAVFFTVGQRIEKAPEVLKMIQDQGHVIGNHTYIHSNERQPRFFAYWGDILRCQSLIEEQTGKRPKLFRPPGGRISFTSLLVSRLTRLRTIMWSLGVEDWRCRTSEEAHLIGEHLIQILAPGDIVLLHDDNPCILIILDILLPEIKSRKLDHYSAIEFLNRCGLSYDRK